MARRFSQRRLKSLKNLTGKREKKKTKSGRVKKDDLFGADEKIAPKIVTLEEKPQKPYVCQSYRRLQRDLKLLEEIQRAYYYIPAKPEQKEQIRNVWGSSTPAQPSKPQSLLHQLSRQVPDSAQSYNPDPQLHYSALESAARYILQQNIEKQRRILAEPRRVSQREENAQSIAIFQKLADHEYEDAEVVPVEIEKEKIEYAAHRAETLYALQRYHSLKQQLAESASSAGAASAADDVSRDAVDNYLALRRELYREIEGNIPDVQLPVCKTQRDEIKQFLEFYTPQKIEEIIKLKALANVRKFVSVRGLQRTGKPLQADFALLEAEEIGCSMKNLRPKGSPFADQVNTFAAKNVIPGYIDHAPNVIRARYKVGLKWWGKK